MRHQLEVSHPSRNDGKAFAADLMEWKANTGKPAGYSMDVDSVICGDEKCEIIPVRIFWDVIGRFDHYELPAGGELTKKDHEKFTPADSEELCRILADPDSPLRWVTSDQIVPPEKAMERADGDDVDGTSGATVLSEKGTVVEGAAYTCHTLWHWANGDARAEIRRITGGEVGRGDLLAFLRSGDDGLASFAMEQVAERKMGDAEIVDAAVGVLERGGEGLAQEALRCIEKISAASDSAPYFRAIERLFPSSAKQKRLLFLKTLSATRLRPPAGFYGRISGWLGSLDTYYEIHLLLNLLAARDPGSAEAAKQVTRLLDNPNFLIARRAYDFLKDGTRNESQRERVEAFREKYEERL